MANGTEDTAENATKNQTNSDERRLVFLVLLL